ncbi:MAG: DUF1778 domain-containing protein [Verrucomicrobiaceae bacterium]|nr:DUF1778 domain-containing protein [Verrucomicrobiaceae bacterium]
MFVISRVREAAEEVVRRHETIRLNRQESLLFAKALLWLLRARQPST